MVCLTERPRILIMNGYGVGHEQINKFENKYPSELLHSRHLVIPYFGLLQ